MTGVDVTVDYPIIEVNVVGMPGAKGDQGPVGEMGMPGPKGDQGPVGEVSNAQLNTALALKVDKAGGTITGALSVGAESPAAPQGPELGSGSGLTQTVTTIVGQTYQVGGAGVTAITADGAPLVVSGGWSSFVATATSHTLVGTGGAALSVKQITGTVPSLFTVGGALEARRRSSNNAFGYTAQYALTTGSSNNAFGYAAQRALTTGSYNNAFGHAAQYELTTGSSNNAFGYAAQYALTTGSYNSAFGYTAQYALTTGSSNNAFGYAAQRALTTGSYNSALGHAAQYHASQNPAVNGTTAIGADSTGEGAYTTEDNTIVLGTPRHRVIMRGPGKGIEMVAPNGSRWNITVANGGTLQVAAA